VAAFRPDQGIQLRFVASNRADLHVLGDEAPCQRPAKAGPDPENERCLTLSCVSLLQSSRPYFFQDLDLIKIQKIIKCEAMTNGA
jgi:hypothetical protein